MDVRKEQNFFEGRVTEYQKASVAGRRRRRGALEPWSSSSPRSCSDLELKRAAALPARCRHGSRRRTAPDAPRRARSLDEDGGRGASSTRGAAARAMVADALAALASRPASEEADTVAARGDRARDHRRRRSRGSHGAATVTVHDVSTLVEAALIARRATSTSPRRSCCDRVPPSGAARQRRAAA